MQLAVLPTLSNQGHFSSIDRVIGPTPNSAGFETDELQLRKTGVGVDETITFFGHEQYRLLATTRLKYGVEEMT